MQLVIQSKGVKLGIENSTVIIHHEKHSERVPASNIESIIMERGCSITSNLICFAAENNIDLIFSGKDGKALARLWSPHFGSITQIRRNQLAFCNSPEAGIWVRNLYMEKISRQQAVLQLLYHPSKINDELLDRSVLFLEKYRSKLDADKQAGCIVDGNTLRGWEGLCSRKYFESISACLPDAYRFERRTQHPALDMFNALLNYAYGILYNLIERALIEAGIDPRIGLFHRDEYNKPSLVYDIIEKYRYWADILVIQLCMQEVIYPDFFEEKNDGIWLQHDGRRILISTFNDYLSEVIDLEGLERSRQEHIKVYCRQLAKSWKGNIENENP